jgi:hypothetical protein
MSSGTFEQKANEANRRRAVRRERRVASTRSEWEKRWRYGKIRIAADFRLA